MHELRIEHHYMFAAIVLGLVILPFIGLVFDKIYKRYGPLYRHRRSGGVYRLLDIATDEKTSKQVVVYRSKESGKVWVRNHSEFFDGRFERLP